MKEIESLYQKFVFHEFNLSSWKECIDWGIERLQKDDDNGDVDIALLAGSTKEWDAEDYTKNVLDKYLPEEKFNREYICGKSLVELYKKFQENEINHEELDHILTTLFWKLDYPDWLVMLSRNCEYATDIEDFRKPFLDEFDYIAGLWSKSGNLKEFLKEYDRAISNTHDLEDLL